MTIRQGQIRTGKNVTPRILVVGDSGKEQPPVINPKKLEFFRMDGYTWIWRREPA